MAGIPYFLPAREGDCDGKKPEMGSSPIKPSRRIPLSSTHPYQKAKNERRKSNHYFEDKR